MTDLRQFEIKMKEEEEFDETLLKKCLDEFKKNCMKRMISLSTNVDDLISDPQRSSSNAALNPPVLSIKTSPDSSPAATSSTQKKRPSSSSSPLRKESESTPVGIHFGLDFLSVGTYNNRTYRKLYGPRPNTIVLGNDEIQIGIPQPQQSFPGKTGKFIEFKSACAVKDFTKLYDAEGGKGFRIEEIVALILSKIHEIVKSTLHTSDLFYVISFPTFFNHSMRGAMIDAVQIAGLNATLIRESCALMCKHVYNGNIQPKITKRFLIAIEDENRSDCDVASYTFQNKNINISEVMSYASISPHSLLNWFGTKWNWDGPVPGIKVALEALLKGFCHPPIVVLCDSSNFQRNTKLIREAVPRGLYNCPRQTASIFQAGFSEIVEGTSMLAAYSKGTSFRKEWGTKTLGIGLTELLNSSKRGDVPELVRSRIQHIGERLTSPELVAIAAHIKEIIVEDSKNLLKAKEHGKRVETSLEKDLENLKL